MTNMGTMDPKNNSFATDTFFDSSVDISNSKTLNQRTALAMIPINITNIPPTSATSTARASGKLSTRHSRLKRKRREKDSSKVKERVPIPSFSCSPIRDDSDQDDISRARYKSASGGGDTTNNDRPLKIMKSSSTCSHKRDALESTAIEVTTLVSSSAKSEKESSSATQHALIESRNEKAMTLAENNSKNPVESIINVDPISTSIINNPTKEQVGCKKDAPPQDNIDQLSDTKELKSLKKGETETNVDTSVKTNKLPALVKPSSFSNVPKDVGGGNKDIYNTSNLNDEVGCIQSNQPIITTSTSSSRFIIPNAYVGASAPQIVEKRDEQITTVPDPPSNSIIQRKHNEIKVATSKYVYQPSLSSPEMDPSDQSKQNHHRHEQSTPKSHDKTENVAVNSSSGDHTVRSSAVPAPSIEKQNPVLQSESVPLGPKSKSLGLTKSGVQKLLKKNKKNKNNPLCESVANTANASKDEIGCKNSLTTEPENIASDKVRRSGISISQKPTSREACGKVNIGMVKTVRAAGQKDSNSIGNGSSANDIQSDTLPSKQPSAVFTKSPYLGGSKKRAGQDSNIINVGQGSKDTRKHRGSTEDIRIMDYYGGNAETKSSKYFGSVKSNSDVIEIVDDEEEVIDMVKPEKELPKKGGTSPNGKKDVKKRHNSSKPSKTRKKNKAPISVSRVFATDSSDDDSEVVATQEKKPVDRKRHRRQTKNSAEAKKCVACSSCKCNSRDSNVKHAPFSNLAGSDARVEQSLVNRLQQLERDAARTEGRRYDVARDLKKHRNRMLKKWEADAPDDQPRFLADAEVSEEWSFALSKGKVDPKKVDRVRGLVFGKNKSKLLLGCPVVLPKFLCCHC